KRCRKECRSPTTSASPRWSEEQRPTWWHISTTAFSSKPGLEPTTSYRVCFMQHTSRTRSDYAIRWYCPIGSLTRLFHPTHSHRRKPPARTRCHLHIHIRRPRPRPSQRKSPSSPNRSSKIEEIKNMKKIIVGFLSITIVILACQIAFAFGRGGSFSGSRGN